MAAVTAPGRRRRLELILDRDGPTCVWCGCEVDTPLVQATTEHVVPRLKGGLVAGERGRRLQALQWSAWSPQPGRLGRRVRWQRLERRSTSARPRSSRSMRASPSRGPTQGPAVHPESTPATAPPDQLSRLSPWRRPRCQRPEDRSRVALAIRRPRASSRSSTRWLARPRPRAPRR